jgi:hypothetical protein
LAHQMYPQRTEYFLEAYTTATAQPHATWWSIWNKRHRTYWD